MTRLPEKIKRLDVTIGTNAPASNAKAGELIKESTYSFRYASDDEGQPSVSLLLGPQRAEYVDGELFPSMDMNLPEGFLLQRILELHPKLKVNKMHLLALMGDNGIGRVGYRSAGDTSFSRGKPISREALLKTALTPEVFQDLVHAYLPTGTGISGVQPKIMLPTRASLPIPDLIVKAAGPAFAGLAANEYLCLSAARHAGISVPAFDLSDDGQLLVLDRFDIRADGGRLGFEDIAALQGLRVNDRLDNRKYHGSYEAMAEVIGMFSTASAPDLHAFFAQLAFTVMVRNGDGHLKNFGLLYDGPGESSIRLSPMFDVVTTTIYKYERPGGFEDVDRTMALKLRKGKHANRAYPSPQELLAFGREVCKVTHPEEVIVRIAGAMDLTLAQAKGDERIRGELLAAMAAQWESGLATARELERSSSARGPAKSGRRASA